jgi:cellulose synthase/poly-beta-1,6-N-acetylglucosamine synthase-like glycosyltransferase
VFASPVRRGKTAVLNHLLAETSAEIVVFTDANAMFPPNALRELLKQLDDPTVGLVSGLSDFSGPASDSRLRNIYYRVLARLKKSEAASSGIAGADGAIYAMRRSLVRELRPDLINDFAHPIDVALQGYRSTISATAIAAETLEDASLVTEYRRQVRMTAQALHVVAVYLPDLIRHRRFRYIAVLIRSKVMRWIMAPVFVVTIVATSVEAALVGPSVWLVLAAAGWVSVVLGVLGVFFQGIAFRAFTYFLLLVAAYSTGILEWIMGNRFVTWQPRAN